LLKFLRKKKTIRGLTKGGAGQVLILLYHRVAELQSDPQMLSVTPQHFSEHLAFLGKHTQIMRLGDVVQALQDGNLPQHGAVITFDDGYADNLYNAKPLLEIYDTPATVYVTTGVMGHKREFWWDELDRILLSPGMLPRTLRLEVNGSLCQWDLGDATYYSEKDHHRDSGWNVLEKYDPTPRQSLYHSLSKLLRPLAERERRKILDDLLSWADADSPGRRAHQILSPGEVLSLVEGGLVEIGAHTVNHPLLVSLPVPTQRAEIASSKQELEEVLGKPVTSFSYPFGGPNDYTRESVMLVKEAGFRWACSNFQGPVSLGADVFQLPRLLVRDWDGDEFARRFQAMFDH